MPEDSFQSVYLTLLSKTNKITEVPKHIKMVADRSILLGVIKKHTYFSGIQQSLSGQRNLELNCYWKN